MRHNVTINSFVDLAMQSWMYHPLQVIKAADVNDYFYESGIIVDGDDWWRTMPIRPVIYEDDSANKYYMELVPYVHPGGASDITLGSLAYAADGKATYTVTLEGRLISEAGALVPTAAGPQVANDVAGLLFTDYFTHFTDNLKQMEHFRVLTIEEGDFLWIVRRGDVELYSSAGFTAGDILNTSTVTAGAVETATAIDSTGTIAQYHATLIDHLWGPNFNAIAQAKADAPVTDLGQCWLELPSRYSR